MESESTQQPISVWHRPIRFARYLNERQIAVLQKDMEIFTIGDLLTHFPFRYEDRSVITPIRDINLGSNWVQCKGRFSSFERLGEGKSKRLVAQLSDSSGSIQVVWFQKIDAVLNAIKANTDYLVYGKLQHFMGKPGYTYPEIELYTEGKPQTGLEPVYYSSETMKRIGLDSRGLARIIEWNLNALKAELSEPFSARHIQEWGLMPLQQAIFYIHKPASEDGLAMARTRLKTEEIFPLQFLMERKKRLNHIAAEGFKMPALVLFNNFYHNHLPFALTGAQKSVLREIRKDLTSGRQMNRLVQGDVGSGKTIVAFLSMLMAIDNGFQACLMAPTEILAAQHYESLSVLAHKIGVSIALLTGSVKSATRKEMQERLQLGSLHILVGTHALIEQPVQFKRLGLAIVDEQHRFGVAQRAKLRSKNQHDLEPHIMVMTATPIPRTLAMAVYGDLDVSVINELPPGRKEIKTVHRTEGKRLVVFGFVRDELKAGRQVYMVYPMIEESETLDLNNLMEGYESVTRFFHEFPVSMVHGKMKPADKDFEMNRFVKGETRIMVATTVIEVGVNVPNASVMVIENAERFGLTQLHQLRGRVGRGSDQSYCILMTGPKLSRDGKMRIEKMVETNDGFEIAEADLKLRGPGDLMGTRQSGLNDLKLTNLSEDGPLLEKIRAWVFQLLEEDFNLQKSENEKLRKHLLESGRNRTYWSQIS